MGYLVDFEKAIRNHDSPSILRLWEEYTSSDEVDPQDFQDILEAVKSSELHEYIGRHVERAIPIWKKVAPGKISDRILQLIVDLQLTNNEELRQITLDHLHQKFGEDPQYQEKMRLIGLRGKPVDFKGAISNFLLLNHMAKGNFVFHTTGWGVGEIMEVSMLREQINLEFDYAPGRKDLPFKFAFTTLIPISFDHFLAKRFGSPDELETLAKNDPVEVIRMLLRDLGPKTASEIKDELCELVIPENEWNRWWQTTRAKIKKDTHIENPNDLKDPFRLLKMEVSHEERLKKALENKPDANTLIQMLYNFFKDFSDTLKNAEFKNSLLAKLKDLLSFKEITAAQELQIQFFLQDLSEEKENPLIAELLKKSESLEKLIQEIPIQSFKKRILVQIRKVRTDWQTIFLNLLFTVEQAPLRDYLLAELMGTEAEKKLKDKLAELCALPQQNPEMLIWYFQKIVEEDSLPLGDEKGKARFFEAFLILLSFIEQKGERRDLVKKMQGILSAGRYQIVRKIMKDSSVAAVQEFLLLVSKCHSLSDHDIKLFHSLAEVAHPSLAKKRKKQEPEEEEEIIWTTADGYNILQKRIEQIGTVETVENAKEIEIARAHGDLRENAEFKAALEKRDRLQTELKFLSTQLNKCRVLTKDDIDCKQVGVGVTVDAQGKAGEKVSYTFLGPWDANPDLNILSFQSKLAKNMAGRKVGDSFEVQGKKFTITHIRSAI